MPTDASKPTIKTDGVAGRIAIRFIREYRAEIHFPEKTGPSSASDPHNAKWLDRRVQEDAPKLAKMIADALSAHERKVRRVIETADAVQGCAVKMNAVSESVGSLELSRLRAALKALEEEK